MPLVSPPALPGRRRRLLGAAAVAGALVGGLVVVPVTAASAAGFPDARNEPASWGGIGCGCAGRLGQSFVVERTGTLKSARVAANAPAGSTVEFYSTDERGYPIDLLGTGRLVGDGNLNVMRTVETPVLSVTAGDRLAIVVDDPASAAVGWTSDTDAYPNGSLIQNFNGSWFAYSDSDDERTGNADMVFSIVVDDGVSPTIAVAPSYSLTVGSSFEADVVLTPATATLSAASELPDGLVIDGDRLVGTPTRSGTTTVTLVSSYGDETAEQPVELAIVGAPTAVSSLEGTGTGGAVDLMWSAPDDQGNAGVVTYAVTATPVGGMQPVAEISTTDLAVTVPNLDNALDYEFSVVPSNVVGAGPVASTVLAPFTVPGVPTQFAVEGQDDGRIQLAWWQPEDDGGRSVESYLLEHRIAGTTDWTVYGQYSVPASQTFVTGLEAGTEYEFRLRAVSSAGAGAATDPVSARFAVAAGAPQALVVEAGDGTVEVSWSAPETDGGSPITRYQVLYHVDGSQSTGDVMPIGTTARITGLPNGVPVQIWVQAFTAAGPGADATVTTVPFRFDPRVVDVDGEAVSTLERGQRIVVSSSALPQGAVVSAELHSEPVALGTATVGADGELALAVQIPESTTLGSHEIVTTLRVEGSDPVTVALPVTIVAAGSTAVGSSALAATGGDVMPTGVAALLLLALGAVLVRRRSATMDS